MAVTSGAIRAGRAFIEIFADPSKLGKGLQDASKRIARWGNSLSTFGTKLAFLGAGIVTPILAAARAFSKTSLPGADRLAAAFKLITDKATMLANKVGSAVTPVIVKLSGIFAKLADSIGKLIDENAGLVAGALLVGGVLIAIGTAAIVAGKALAVLGAIGAFVFSPAGLVIGGALVLLGLLYKFGALTTVFSFIMRGAMALDSALGGVVGTVSKMISGINAALGKGDIQLAFKIVTVGIELIWAKMIDSLTSQWLDFISVYGAALRSLNPFSTVDDQVKADNAREKQKDALGAEARRLQAELDALIGKAKSPERDKFYEGKPFMPGSTAGTFNGTRANQVLGTGRTLRDILEQHKSGNAILKAILKKRGKAFT